ncbi:MAG: hypothetical protein IK954_02325 [Clostridia bacterium]|nr:hypothetical protein [Clostridia bacterium]
MSLAEILAIFGLGGTGGAVLLLSLIEVSPIKVKPLSWLMQKLGKALNRDVMESLQAQREETCATRNELAEHIATDCRARILRFGDEVLHGQRHSKEHFEQILLDIKQYDRYCEEHPSFENNITELTSKRIKEVYCRCLETYDFL